MTHHEAVALVTHHEAIGLLNTFCIALIVVAVVLYIVEAAIRSIARLPLAVHIHGVILEQGFVARRHVVLARFVVWIVGLMATVAVRGDISLQIVHLAFKR